MKYIFLVLAVALIVGLKELNKKQKLIIYILLTWLVGLACAKAIFGLALFEGYTSQIIAMYYSILALTVLVTIFFIVKILKLK